jgi:hypothetical protein
VDTGSDRQIQQRESVPDLLRGAHGSPGALEDRDEPVSGGLDHVPTTELDLVTADSVVLVEQLAPSAVAHGGGAFGRADDVRDEHGRQDAFGERRGPGAGHELLDLGHDGVGLVPPELVVDARDLDQPRTGNLGGHPPAAARAHRQIPVRVEDQGRRLHRREEMPNVRVDGHEVEPEHHARAGG